MAQLALIRGLKRDSSSSISSGEMSSFRGVRVPAYFGATAGGKQFPSSLGRARQQIGTGNAGVIYRTLFNGKYGNSVVVVQNTPSGSNNVLTVTYSAGVPTITITPSTTATAATLAAFVNDNEAASDLIVASLAGTGASAPVANSNVAHVYTIAQGSGSSSGGTFTISIPGFGTTSALAYNATGATVATAVQTLIRTNPGNSSATVTGSGTTLPASTTLTLGAAGGANLTFPDATIDSSLLTPASTYTILSTTVGQSATGVMNSGLDSGTGQPIYVSASSQVSVPVDIDDPQTVRALQRNWGRWVSL